VIRQSLCLLLVLHEPPPPTAPFARSRLPRSLLNAHRAAAGVGLGFILLFGAALIKLYKSY